MCIKTQDYLVLLLKRICLRLRIRLSGPKNPKNVYVYLTYLFLYILQHNAHKDAWGSPVARVLPHLVFFVFVFVWVAWMASCLVTV